MRFYQTLVLAQVRRACLKANIKSSFIKTIEAKISKERLYIEKHAHIKTFSLQKLVQLQLMMIFETLNAMERTS